MPPLIEPKFSLRSPLIGTLPKRRLEAVSLSAGVDARTMYLVDMLDELLSATTKDGERLYEIELVQTHVSMIKKASHRIVNPG